MASEQNLLPLIARKSPLDKVVVNGIYGNSDQGANIFIKEHHPLSIVQIEIKTGSTDIFLKKIKKSLGIEMSLETNRSAFFNKTRIIWTGPNKWIVTEPESRNLQSFLNSELKGIDIALIDLSHGRSCIGISGLMTRDLLSKGAAIDWHPNIFLVNHSVQTTLFNLPALIYCEENNNFNVFVARGFARDFWKRTTEAAEEFGYEVA